MIEGPTGGRSPARRLPQGSGQPALAGARCRERSVQRRTLRVPGETAGPGQDRLVGRHRRVSACQAAGEVLVLLAADRTCPCAAGPCPADGASRGSRLEAGAPCGGEGAGICRLISPRHSESLRSGKAIPWAMARRAVLSSLACAPMIFPCPMTWTRLQGDGLHHDGEGVCAGGRECGPEGA